MQRWLAVPALIWLGLAGVPGMAGAGQVNPHYNPPPAKRGYSYPDCYCTDSEGRRVELGQSVCLKIGQRRVLARCGMSANNPAWRYESEDGCPGV